MPQPACAHAPRRAGQGSLGSAASRKIAQWLPVLAASAAAAAAAAHTHLWFREVALAWAPAQGLGMTLRLGVQLVRICASTHAPCHAGLACTQAHTHKLTMPRCMHVCTAAEALASMLAGKIASQSHQEQPHDTPCTQSGPLKQGTNTVQSENAN